MTKLRLAYFSPLPPDRSGIADYSADLLPHLAPLADITLFASTPAAVTPALQAAFPVLPLDDYPAQRFHFDLPIYHMGNNIENHEAIYQMMRRYPGVMVLHDYRLHHFIAHRTAGRDDFLGYMREVAYVLGPAGVNQLRDHKLRALGVTVPPQAAAGYTTLENLALCERLATLNLGTIVHSHYVQAQLQAGLAAQGVSRPVSVIPMLMPGHPTSSQRHRLPWPANAIILASAGYLTPDKRPEQALRAFARLRQRLPEARYLFIGQLLAPDLNLDQLIAELGLAGVVFQTGFAPDLAMLLNWMATADVLVALRDPTVGETSGAVLRALSIARPVIVYDHGWYSELPDDCCLKVPPGDEEALLAAMSRLAESAALRRRMGRSAMIYTQNELQPGRVAAAYLAFLQSVLEKHPDAP